MPSLLTDHALFVCAIACNNSGNRWGQSLALFIAVSIVYKILLWKLTDLAWLASIERIQRDDEYNNKASTSPIPTLTRPKPYSVVEGWTLAHMSPSYWGVESWLQFLVHTPCYVWRICGVFVYWLPRNLLRRYLLRQSIRDQDIWNLITQTSLFMLCDMDETGTKLSFRGEPCTKPIFINNKERREALLDGSSLVLEMELQQQPDGSNMAVIIQAHTDAGDIRDDVKWMAKNEIIFDLLMRTATMWVHPQSHVGSESCASSISRHKLNVLKTGALFTHSLHDGLLHGPLSPLSDTPIFRSAGPGVHITVAGLKHRIPHDFHHRIKAPRKSVPLLDYYIKAHSKVARHLLKHKIAHLVDVNDFFAATVVHSTDHFTIYNVLDKLPARPAYNDGHVSWWLSIIENTMFDQVWTKPLMNPFYSEFIKDSDTPFYQELYKVRQIFEYVIFLYCSLLTAPTSSTVCS